ncbi:MAG TPA: hypothetical protein VM260_15995, partial [Pirellula sp.]|nr:hypothetical protein [Pirellula sp.]
ECIIKESGLTLEESQKIIYDEVKRFKLKAIVASIPEISGVRDQLMKKLSEMKNNFEILRIQYDQDCAPVRGELAGINAQLQSAHEASRDLIRLNFERAPLQQKSRLEELRRVIESGIRQLADKNHFLESLKSEIRDYQRQGGRQGLSDLAARYENSLAGKATIEAKINQAKLEFEELEKAICSA